MKQIIIPVILTTAICSQPVLADDSNISFYGQAHVSLDYLDDGEDGGLNVSSNTSRFGIRASHKLESNLTVLLQIESLVRIDEGSGSLSSRDSYVGLKGDYGLVRAGYFDTPMKQVRNKTDLFGNKAGDARNIVRGGGVDLDKRMRNSLHYQSPAYNNFTFDLQYSSNEETGATTDNKHDSVSASVTYNAKDLLVILAYELQNQEATEDRSGARLAATYKLNEQWYLVGFLQHSQDFSGGDRNAWGAGIRYKLDKYDLSAQYYQANSADLSDSGASMFALGVDRRVTKELSFYSALVFTDNQENASFNVTGGGGHGKPLTVVTGEDPLAVSFGAIYRF